MHSTKRIPSFQKAILGKAILGKSFGVWSTGNITEEMVQNCLEHHRRPNDITDDNFILD